MIKVRRTRKSGSERELAILDGSVNPLLLVPLITAALNKVSRLFPDPILSVNMQSESTVVCKLLPPRIFWAGVLFPHFLHQYFLVIFFLFSQYPILFYLCGLYLFVFLYIKYFSHCPFYLPSQSTTIFLSNTLTSVSVQSLSRVWLFATAWTALCQASLSITNSQNLLKLMSIESVMPSNHLILCRLLLLPPSIFSSIKVFGGQSIGVSALTSLNGYS